MILECIYCAGSQPVAPIETMKPPDHHVGHQRQHAQSPLTSRSGAFQRRPPSNNCIYVRIQSYDSMDITITLADGVPIYRQIANQINT